MLTKITRNNLKSTVARAFATTNAAETERNNKYLARTYLVWDPVISKAYGVWMEDVEGKKYLDFHSGYCCTNQGHAHPKILKTLHEQSQKLAMCSRAFNTDVSGEFAEYVNKLFGYDKMIPQSSGSESCETAIKLARRWAYDVKGVEKNKAEVLLAKKCFWGRTIAGLSGSDDPLRYEGFGPYAPGFSLIPFNDTQALDDALTANPNICAYMVEPIQGEGGVIVPDDGYLKKCQDICKKHNVLFITDEIQAGLGRAGDMLCHYHEEGVRPDIVILGKAISAGMIPVSVALADSHITDLIGYGQHGSTYGGYALGLAVSKTALEVIEEEDLCNRSKTNGAYFREELGKVESPLIKEVRGRGLFNSLELSQKGLGKDFASRLAFNGLACKNTHDTTIRLAPPLIIEKPELDQAVDIISKTLKEFE